MPQPTENIVIPIVHLNGTSKQELLELREKLYVALDNAYAALRQMAPNGRDYYPKPGLMDKAVEQHTRRMKILDNLQNEIQYEMAQIEFP